MRLRATSPVLIGRDVEMARLMEHLDTASGGEPTIALVSGAAGVGKTRLVSELVARARRRGVQAWIGRCVDLGEATSPLAPLRDIVAALSDELDSESLELALGGARGVLSQLVPELGDARDVEPVPTDQLCELVVGVFARLARRAPVLVVIEDLHWADTTTRALFSALAHTWRRVPLLLAGTFRSDELNRRHPLLPMLADIERHVRCDRMDLAVFDRADTARLVDAIGRIAPTRTVVDEIYRRTAGNAFFVEELVAAQAAGASGPSDTLRDVILARAAKLDDTAVRLLMVAAAAGSTRPDVLADACVVPGEVLRPVLEVVLATALLVADGEEVRFRHELGREVFYDELLPGERARVHARLAASIETRQPGRLGEIARHWSAAHDGPRALAASIAAGRQALRAGAAAEAEGHLGRALELWDTVEVAEDLAGVDHPALLVEAATAAEHARHLDRAIELDLRAVAELAAVDPLREADVWLELRDLYRFLQRWDECGRAVTRALALIPASPPSRARAVALAHAASGYIYAGQPADALAAARDAVAVAEQVDDAAAVVTARTTLAAAMSCAGDRAGALELDLANLERCGPHLPPRPTLTALNGVTNGLALLGRFREIPGYAAQGVELARRTGLGGARGSWMATYWIQSLTMLGRFAEAEQLVEDLADLLDHPSEEGQLAVSWGTALIRQGRYDEARPLVEDARRSLESGRWAEDLAWQAAVVIEFDAAMGRFDDFESLVELSFATGCGSVAPDSIAVVVATAIEGLCLRASSRRSPQRHGSSADPAAVATGWVSRIHDVNPRTAFWAPDTLLHRSRAVALAARLNGADDPGQWALLAAGWADLGFRYDEAVARFHLAESLLADVGGRSSAARRAAAVELTSAQCAAADLGAAPLLARVDDLARRARLGSEFAAESDADGLPSAEGLGLTQRELTVLELLARGYSNGQIGKELFISTKTASVHVSSILRKLGVRNRVEAAAFAHRSGAR